jgi:hypothetical protein
MTERFVTAAELMARSLGAGGYRFVTIPHPLSSATPDELAARARTAAAACVVELVAAGAEDSS